MRIICWLLDWHPFWVEEFVGSTDYPGLHIAVCRFCGKEV